MIDLLFDLIDLIVFIYLFLLLLIKRFNYYYYLFLFILFFHYIYFCCCVLCSIVPLLYYIGLLDFLLFYFHSGQFTYCTGLTDEATEGVFVWIDGNNATFTNWNLRNPDNPEDDEACVSLRGKRGKLISQMMIEVTLLGMMIFNFYCQPSLEQNLSVVC